MQHKRFIGVFNLILAALLLITSFLLAGYEAIEYRKYLLSLGNDSTLPFYRLTLYVFFASPLALFACLFFLIAGIKFLRGTDKRKTAFKSILIKGLSIIGLIVVFFLFLALYPTGWFSKIFYLATALICLGGGIVEYLFFKKEPKENADNSIKKK